MKKVLFIFLFTKILIAVEQPKKYISLAPNTTEILFALGLDKEIVAVSSLCDYPKQVNQKIRVGEFSHPNMEKIVYLKPDYIFCTGLEQGPVISALKQLKFNIYVSDPPSIKDLFITIKDIAKITNKVKEGDALIKKMQADIDNVQAQVKLVPWAKRPKTFLEIWDEPLITAGKGSFIDEILFLAGANNIAHELERPYSYFSVEKLISLNPDYIFKAHNSEKKPTWENNNINAVKNKKVFNDIDPNIILRPGPRVTEALKEINRRLYH